MQKLTQIEKEIYASAINSLFGGSVQATPDQITLSITQDVDTMIQEISKCSKAVGSFAFEMFYNFVLAWIPGKAVEYVFEGVEYQITTLLGQFVATELVNAGVQSLLNDLVLFLSRSHRFIGCLYQARANWRSKIQLELMGL